MQHLHAVARSRVRSERAAPCAPRRGPPGDESCSEPLRSSVRQQVIARRVLVVEAREVRVSREAPADPRSLSRRGTPRRREIAPRAARLPGSVKRWRRRVVDAIKSVIGGLRTGPADARLIPPRPDRRRPARLAVQPGVGVVWPAPLCPACRPAVPPHAPVADAVSRRSAGRVRAHDLRFARAVCVQPLGQRHNGPRRPRTRAPTRPPPLAAPRPACRGLDAGRRRGSEPSAENMRSPTHHCLPRRGRARGRTRSPTPPHGAPELMQGPPSSPSARCVGRLRRPLCCAHLALTERALALRNR